MRYPIFTSRLMLFAVLILPALSVNAQIPAGGSSARDIPSARSNNDLNPFDPTLERLPAEYIGANVEALHDHLVARRKSAQKDEFETTQQFRLRVQKEAEAPILGGLKTDSVMAVAGDVDASYDADQQVMHLVVLPSNFGHVELAGYKGRAFVADVKLDIPTAKKTKENLSALAVFRLRAPYIQEGYASRHKVLAQLLEVWVYDFSTGQVFAKKRADEGVSSLPPSSPLLRQAYDLYAAHRDDEALEELHRVVTIDPTNAEVYLLNGRINQRRGDPNAAISALKTALFWDPNLIDAHILLGRIFLERGDRSQATSYADSALNIDSTNPEAIELKRQVTTGKN